MSVNRFFFLDAPGGTGKTFLLNLLLAKIRSNRQVVLAVAYSGIAATLLEGGRTSHSMFKLPLDIGLLETPVCNIRKCTRLAHLLQTTKIIVWDECTMAHKATLEALDRTPKDLYNSDKLMGGVCVFLAGDFGSILPVIPRRTPADELKACLKDSYIWHCVEVCKLTTNMRVHMGGDDALGEFSAQLLNIGEGKLPANNGLISLPDNCRFIVDTEDNLLQKVYPNIHENYLQHQWLKKRVILAPKDDTVDHINQLLL
ncbi:ATP-dependent DNA helicase pif1-like [Watersipora subatra]|uniref:ATP-dependent DNA helicase pif1-like n=1 Tax=Watersipora subatra TaxID=2589382 RepID=UPI00355C4874